MYNCVQLCKHIFMPTGSRLLCSNILHEKDVLKIAEYHSDIIIPQFSLGQMQSHEVQVLVHLM